jgi:hypothetical protein
MLISEVLKNNKLGHVWHVAAPKHATQSILKKFWPDIVILKHGEVNSTDMYEYDVFQAIAVAVEIVLKQLNHQMKDGWQKR